jgi:hypothetical protein
VIQSPDDLRTAIRALAEHEPDPARVTHKLLMSITPEEARVVVNVTLVEYVRREMSRAYIAASDASEGRSYATQDGRRTPSAQTAAIRDWVGAELGKSVNVAPDRGREWKFLGDCDRDECLTLATNRHRKAAEVTAEAERYERVAEAMEVHEVETVRQLPRPVLEELLR